MHLKSLLCFALFLLVQQLAHAQNPHANNAQAREAMKKLQWLEGSWAGKGQMKGAQGEIAVNVTEVASYRLQNSILMVEGRGVTKDPSGEERVVHDAFGVIWYDHESREYKVTAFKADGLKTEAKVEVGDRKLVWELNDPRGAKIRFSVSLDSSGKWHEKGEYLQDADRSFEFFKMELEKKN